MFLCVINGFVHVHFFIFEFCFLVDQLGVGLLVHLEVYEMVQITDYYSVPVNPHLCLVVPVEQILDIKMSIRVLG